MPSGRVFKPEQYINQRYGRLTVIEFSEFKKSGKAFRHAMFLCDCECGSRLDVSIYNLRSGNTVSCGCYRTEINTKHGCHQSAEYSHWEHMITRATSDHPDVAKYYKSRGITVCPDWIGDGGFQRFLEHIGPRPSSVHTVDRIDNNRGYEPGNVRWATRSQQARNTRRNRVVTVGGEDMCLTDACRKLGLSYHRVLGRLRSGWSQARALELKETAP